MTEKDGPDKFPGETNNSDDPFFINDKDEGLDDIQDSDEEIIELTDPDDAPVDESEEEIIEPADFLDELSVNEPGFVDKDGDASLPLNGNDDIIELTDTVDQPSAAAQPSDEMQTSESDLPSEDKDLFVFTDSGDEAYIEDADILSDTVFADEPDKGDGQYMDSDPEIDKEPGIPVQKEEERESQDIGMFNDTVFANEPSDDEDEELAVLTEIDETSPQVEKEMFNDTVFSGDPLEKEDEELDVLTEPKDKKMEEEAIADVTSAFIEEPSVDDSSDMVLLEDTENEIPAAEDAFIEPDPARPSENDQLMEESISDTNIADSLGMNLESDINLTENIVPDDEVELAIEPESLETEPEQLETSAAKSIDPDSLQTFQQEQTVSSEPISIQPEQLEAALEKVIKKLFGQKIDSLIVDVIEKAVQADIDKIKKELLKGITDDS